MSFLTTAPTPRRPGLVYGPFIIGWLGVGVLTGIPVRTLGVAFLVGVLEWSLIEYVNHRFLYHWRPRNHRLREALDSLHAHHHRNPYQLTGVVAPLTLSIPFAIGNLLLLYALLDDWVLAGQVNAGFGAGYLVYECTHYATHMALLRGEPWPRWAGYHLAHHFENAKTRFGVTNTFWDHVFFTYRPPAARMPSRE